MGAITKLVLFLILLAELFYIFVQGNSFFDSRVIDWTVLGVTAIIWLYVMSKPSVFSGNKSVFSR